VRMALTVLFLAWSAATQAALPVTAWQHATEIERTGPASAEYLMGLGALQKIGGRWRHKHSELVTGQLQRITWQVKEGFTAEEGYEFMTGQLEGEAELLFECDGRSCGSSAQWAAIVFERRELYGHDERQRYSAWRLQREDGTWWVVLYAVDRANRRHYLHVDLLQQAEPAS